MLENLHSSKNGRNFASLLAQKQNGSESKTETAASERREIIEIFAKRKILTNANALEKQGDKEPSLSSRFRMTGLRRNSKSAIQIPERRVSANRLCPTPYIIGARSYSKHYFREEMKIRYTTTKSLILAQDER